MNLTLYHLIILLIYSWFFHILHPVNANHVNDSNTNNSNASLTKLVNDQIMDHKRIHSFHGIATYSTNAQLLNRSFGTSSSPKRRSVATYYTPFDDACTGSSSRESQLIVAISSHLYGDSRRRSKYCGHCVRIHGPKGHVVAKVMDACPSCSPFSLDLSPMAFAMIGELNDGRVGIQWSWTICPSDEDFSSNDTDLDTSYTNDIADLQVKLVRHYYLHALQAEIAYALMRQALREMQQSDNPSSYPLEIDDNVGDDQDRLGQVVLK